MFIQNHCGERKWCLVLLPFTIYVQPINDLFCVGNQLTWPTKMYKTSFWMKHYNCKTPKRTRLWSWSWGVSIFNKGSLRKKTLKSTIKTSESYTDSKGVRRWKGTSALKGTQFLPGNLIYFTVCTVIISCFFFPIHTSPTPCLISWPPRVYTPSFAAAVLQSRRTLRKTRGVLPQALVIANLISWFKWFERFEGIV